MKKVFLPLLVIAFLSWTLVGEAADRKFFSGHPGPKITQPITCTGSKATKSTSVADPVEHATSVDYMATNGGFDPTPLLTIVVNVGGHSPSCLVAHFSVMPLAGFGVYDEYVVFQVSVDGTPMIGHFPEPFGIASPAVGVTPDLDNEMSAYNFFATVTPGPHTVTVRFATCCNNKGGAALAPVLTLEHT